MTRFLDAAEVVDLHNKVSGAPLTNLGALEGAVARPYAGWGDYLEYPSIWAQVSVLLHGVCAAHAFFDGNKRAAWLACTTFLEMNGYLLIDMVPKEWTDYVDDVAQHLHTLEETAFWFAARVDLN